MSLQSNSCHSPVVLNVDRMKHTRNQQQWIIICKWHMLGTDLFKYILSRNQYRVLKHSENLNYAPWYYNFSNLHYLLRYLGNICFIRSMNWNKIQCLAFRFTRIYYSRDNVLSIFYLNGRFHWKIYLFHVILFSSD